MKYLMAGVADESVPDISDHLLGLDIDHEELRQHLGKSLGRHRFEQEYRFPNASTEKKELDEYVRALEKMIEYSSYGGLPPVVQTLFDARALKAGINAIEFQDSLSKSLTYALAIAKSVQEESRQWKSPRGAPQQTSRDGILNDLVPRLQAAGATAANARKRAEDILVACRIDVPSGERSVRRAQKRRRGDK